ncbi:MAG: hypothetical protein AAF604_17400 [Acidobacteriota bacterium]
MLRACIALLLLPIAACTAPPAHVAAASAGGNPGSPATKEFKAPGDPKSATTSPTIRGITVSTHRDGQDWGTDVIDPALDDLQSVGANWVAIHPYGWIRGDGTVRFREFDPENPPAHITRPIAAAHARGLKILIKPHLGYWRSPFRWRGDITFDDDASWERFWSSYERWILAMAHAARGADAFAVGTELDRTLDQSERWRTLIAKVRRIQKAPLTYAANWTDYQRVEFWDDLDWIGIQAYFPLTEEALKDPRALEPEITAGWRQEMQRLRAFADRHERDIVFTELGYNRSFSAPVAPWEYRTDGAEAEAIQAVCLRVALDAVEGEPRVLGSFLWKWFPPPHTVGRNFQLATPELRRVIGDAWDR